MMTEESNQRAQFCVRQAGAKGSEEVHEGEGTMTSIFNLDPSLLEQVNLLGEINSSEHAKMLSWSMDILEGQDIATSVTGLAEAMGLGVNKLVKICTALATMLWECSKMIKKDTSTLPGILVQVGVREDIVGAFCTSFAKSRLRMAALKLPLGLSVLTYKDMSWRLDVELAKRSLLSTNTPSFQLRLDLNDQDAGTKTMHLQADYANLKRLQEELQKAVDEYAGVHSQRIIRYIS